MLRWIAVSQVYSVPSQSKAKKYVLSSMVSTRRQYWRWWSLTRPTYLTLRKTMMSITSESYDATLNVNDNGGGDRRTGCRCKESVRLVNLSSWRVHIVQPSILWRTCTVVAWVTRRGGIWGYDFRDSWSWLIGRRRPIPRVLPAESEEEASKAKAVGETNDSIEGLHVRLRMNMMQAVLKWGGEQEWCYNAATVTSKGSGFAWPSYSIHRSWIEVLKYFRVIQFTEEVALGIT